VQGYVFILDWRLEGGLSLEERSLSREHRRVIGAFRCSSFRYLQEFSQGWGGKILLLG
jgi:hypothetical protein